MHSRETAVLAAHAAGLHPVAVVGAHLTGQPLNWTAHCASARGSSSTCRTAPDYRLYALGGTMPPKPGLVREPAVSAVPASKSKSGPFPNDQFGGFVAGVPPPLGIGNAALETGEVVKCFICEPYAVADAAEITQFGGWRGYLVTGAASKR